MKELYVEGNIAEDRAVWSDEQQSHCEEVYDDREETAEMQNERIMKFKTSVNKRFTEDGRRAESTVDVVRRTRAKMAEERVKWVGRPKPSQRCSLPQEKVHDITLLPRPLHGTVMTPDSW